MAYVADRMPRPLTGAERARIERPRRKLEDLQRRSEEAIRERDEAIREAFNARALVTEIADAAGVSRNTIYAILQRLADGD